MLSLHWLSARQACLRALRGAAAAAWLLPGVVASASALTVTNAMNPFLLTKRPRLGHIGHMSAVAKCRIDPELKRQAESVLEEIGLKPRAALELFYKQIIKRRAIPFPVRADSPEDDVLSPAVRRNALADEF
jgi:addiction module RelB/DinJ family antitoxin